MPPDVRAEVGRLLAGARETAAAERRRDAAGAAPESPAGATRTPESPLGCLDTLALLDAIAGRWPAAPPPDTLHALCRRLGVARQVWTAYDVGWKRLPDAAPLGPGGLVLLGAVCLAGAAAEGELGLRLKALNGALVAIDRVPPSTPLAAELGETAGALLETLA